MSQAGIEQLIGKALSDKKFMEALVKDPEKKIKESALDISQNEIELIKKVNTQKAKQFAETFAQEFSNRKEGFAV